MYHTQSRNPFVNQVSFFVSKQDAIEYKGRSQSLRKSGQFLYEQCSGMRNKRSVWSQSLRKSGQFLSGGNEMERIWISKGRNPFVNQVSFFDITLSTMAR